MNPTLLLTTAEITGFLFQGQPELNLGQVIINQTANILHFGFLFACMGLVLIAEDLATIILTLNRYEGAKQLLKNPMLQSGVKMNANHNYMLPKHPNY